MIAKYTIKKISPPDVARNCWYEIPIKQVEPLFNDERYIGEIVHLYNDEDGAESLIDSNEKLSEALSEARENNTYLVIHVNDLYAQPELFEITTEVIQ